LNNLIITAIGSDRPGIVSELSGIITTHGGNVEESRMSRLGSDFAIIMLVSVSTDWEESLGVARQGRRVVGGPLARRTERDLGVLVRAIESVRSLSKADAQTDPDLIPEDVRAQEWRETREVTRQARLTAIQGSESPARGDG